MRTLYTRNYLAIWTLVLIALMGAGSLSFGQGKGRGGGNGNGGDRKGGQQAQQSDSGNERQRADNPGKQQRQERQEQRPQQQQVYRQERQAPQQPRYERAPDQRQDRQADQARQNRGWQAPGRNNVEQQARERQGRMPDYNKIQRQPDYGIGNVPKNDREIQRQGGGDRSILERQASPSWNNAWPNNYGYQRSNEAHARNAERKALKDRARTSDRYYDSRDYPQYGYNYDQRDASRDSILRSVISRVLASNSGDYNYVPQYSGYNYGIPYQPVYYDGGYYDQYPQYQSYSGTSPYYYDSQPYNYAYSQNYGDPYYSNGYGSNPGLFNLNNSFLGGGFIGRLFSKLLALGYNQGYNDAQYARSNGYGDQYYQDPYVYQDSYGYQDNSYQNAGYDRYSCLAENRRYMSEGYELGYRDALNSRNQYDRYNNSGSGDLISLLLGNILRIN